MDPTADISSTYLYESEDKWWILLQIHLQHIYESEDKWWIQLQIHLQHIYESEDKWWIQLQIPLQDISLNLKINGSSWIIWLNMLDLSRDKTSLKINSESNQRIQPENLPHYGKSNQRWNFTEDIWLYFQGPLNIPVTMETTL